MLTVFDYYEIGLRIPLTLLTLYTLKKLIHYQIIPITTILDLNPIVIANFILVVTDLYHLVASTIHDNAARFWEFETFGAIGSFIYLYSASFRYWLQIYTLCLISILHLVAICAPGHFRALDRKWTFFLLMIPTVLTIITDTLYNTLCACLFFQIPGYYLNIRPERRAVEDVVEIFDAWLKITMFIFLIVTDLAIIMKLYKMNILGKKKNFQEALQKTAQTIASLSAIVIVEQSTNKQAQVQKQPVSRLKIAIDKRLAIAFTWISFAFVMMTLYFRYFYLFPTGLLPYMNILVYNFEYTKCTIYVLIVTKK